MKKIAIINDISGYGRCSVSVMLPIVSHMGVQGCVVPTAIFSNHTGFPSFYNYDFTSHMEAYVNEWKKLGLKFDGVTSGFLGSAEQIHIVEDIIKWQREIGTPVVIVDPVMGDNGKIYATYTREMCDGMRHLVADADIITPNLTEACFLTDTPYRATGWSQKELSMMTNQLHQMGASKVVITGIVMGDKYIATAVSEEVGSDIKMLRQQMVSETRSGTGDVFASVICADAVQGVPLTESVRKASKYVKMCLIETAKTPGPVNTGIDFEPVLRKL